MTVTRKLVLAVADWWEKQDGGDTNQPYADRLRSAAMWGRTFELPEDGEELGKLLRDFTYEPKFVGVVFR